MPKSMYDDDDKLVALTAWPADPDAPTAAEATAGTDWSLSVMAPFDLDVTDSDRVSQRAIGEPTNTETFGKKNASGVLDLFRFYDSTDGQPHATEDFAFTAAKTPGTILYFMRREGGKDSDAPLAIGDEVSLWEVETDEPQTPKEEGYRRSRIPLAVKRFRKNVVIVA